MRFAFLAELMPTKPLRQSLKRHHHVDTPWSKSILPSELGRSSINPRSLGLYNNSTSLYDPTAQREGYSARHTGR
jgi:hypothetical protein